MAPNCASHHYILTSTDLQENDIKYHLGSQIFTFLSKSSKWWRIYSRKFFYSFTLEWFLHTLYQSRHFKCKWQKPTLADLRIKSIDMIAGPLPNWEESFKIKLYTWTEQWRPGINQNQVSCKPMPQKTGDHHPVIKHFTGHLPLVCSTRLLPLTTKTLMSMDTFDWPNLSHVSVS